MRGCLIALLFTFLVGPAHGQYIHGEGGTTLPRGSFSYAKTGFQAGLTGRVPIVTSDLTLSAAARISYNVNPTPQDKDQRIMGLLGPEVSYARGRIFTKVQVGGGISFAPWTDRGTASVIRSRIAVGVETPSGRQLSIGPTHAATVDNQWWWGISCAFSF
jgi:hypothetical protein